MKNVYNLRLENGTYEFKLKKILEQRHISIYRIMKDTNTDFKVLQRILTGNVCKLDLIVLARICDYLKCSLSSILEYNPDINTK